MEERDDFLGFLEELVTGKDLEQPAAGIAKQVIASGGMRGLSSKQHYALVAGVTTWIGERFSEYEPGTVAFGSAPPVPRCTDCENPMPWSEVYRADQFSGHCSYCEQVRHKPDD